MKIGTIEAGAGEKAYGQFKTGETHGRFPVHIPLHIINGAADGPTLVVQSGLSGLEIEPALVLPQIVKELDPTQIKGTVVIVPLMNTSGFEFTQIVSAWDGKHLNKLGRGNANGTINEQMIAQYYETVITPADALLDIRTGSQWAYHRYAGVYSVGDADKSQAMAVTTGLPQVVTGQQEDGSLAYEAAQDGKAVVVANIGGGPGLRDHRADDMARNRRAVLNSMRHMGMLDGEMDYESDTVAVIEAHTVIMPHGERGFTFMDTSKRGTQVAAGEEIGFVRHPFTGERVQTITAPQAGVVVFAGASWPVPLEDTLL
ncbi:MAG: succinylglutamate desuccinylase/aspartoacylase family protein, partial [Chloroflexota bacterium]